MVSLCFVTSADVEEPLNIAKLLLLTPEVLLGT